MAVKINIRANPNEITVQAVAPVPTVCVSANFHTIRREVIALPKQEKKLMKRQLTTTITGLLLICSAQTAFAAPSDELVSSDLMTLFLGLILMAVILGVFLAIICMVLAGITKMFNQEAMAEAWTQNIMKGFGQVLLGPVIIITIVFMCHLLFRNSAFYIDPWKVVSTFFGK